MRKSMVGVLLIIALLALPLTGKRLLSKPSQMTKATESVALKTIERIGGAEGDRTPDLMTASHALSQLSYGPR